MDVICLIKFIFNVRIFSACQAILEFPDIKCLSEFVSLAHKFSLRWDRVE